MTVSYLTFTQILKRFRRGHLKSSGGPHVGQHGHLLPRLQRLYQAEGTTLLIHRIQFRIQE